MYEQLLWHWTGSKDSIPVWKLKNKVSGAMIEREGEGGRVMIERGISLRGEKERVVIDGKRGRRGKKGKERVVMKVCVKKRLI